MHLSDEFACQGDKLIIRSIPQWSGVTAHQSASWNWKAPGECRDLSGAGSSHNRWWVVAEAAPSWEIWGPMSVSLTHSLQGCAACWYQGCHWEHRALSSSLFPATVAPCGHQWQTGAAWRGPRRIRESLDRQWGSLEDRFVLFCFFFINSTGQREGVWKRLVKSSMANRVREVILLLYPALVSMDLEWVWRLATKMIRGLEPL